MSSPIPAVSVVIPAFNYGRFLPKAIRSALEQGIDTIEVVIVDDCSTDDTAQRIAPLLDDPRVRYIRNDFNLGAVPNVNKAFGEAHAPYVLLLGADDFLLPGGLQRLLRTLSDHPEAGFAYGAYVIADDEDRVVSTIHHPGHLPCNIPPGRDDLPALLTFDHYIYLGACLFRTSVIREHGAFDPTLTIDESPGRFFRATDWDLALRLAQRGVLSAFEYAPLSAFRVHGNQASLGQSFDQEGIGPREAAVLLDRYVVPENRSRLAGHEDGIRQMIAGKHAYFSRLAHPERCGDPLKVFRSFERADGYLRSLAADPCDEAIESPSISVVLVLRDDPEALEQLVPMFAAQQIEDMQIVVINRGRLDMKNLCSDTRLAAGMRYVHLPGASLAEARNTGARVSREDFLYFVEPGMTIDADYLAALRAPLAQQGCLAVQSQVAAFEPAECRTLLPAWRDLLRMVLPPGHPWSEAIPPLPAFALRRHLFLRMGGFDTSLPLLSDLDFILRLERDHPVLQLSERAGTACSSLIASLYRQSTETGGSDTVERSLQALIRRHTAGQSVARC